MILYAEALQSHYLGNAFVFVCGTYLTLKDLCLAQQDFTQKEQQTMED